MKQFISFISSMAISVIFLGLTTGINAQNIDKQESSGNELNHSEDYRVKFGERPPLDLENLPEDSYYPGIIRIQFERGFEETLEDIDFDLIDNGHVKTGIQALDELNKAYKVNEYEPMLKDLYKISEASLKYKERHRAWGFHLWHTLRLDNNADIIQAINDFESLDKVKVAEPSFKIKLIEPVESRPAEKEGRSGWSPDDPQYSNQWHFHNTGQTIGGQTGVPGWDCNAEAAWEIETGNDDVIVAIIDTGMEFDHEDLEGNMWEDIGPQGTATPSGSHGTHCGGTVAAVTNNSIGVAGLAGGSGSDDGVRLMTIHALGGGSMCQGAAHIYAADNGAAITSNSWSMGGPNIPINPSYADGIDYFNEEGGGTALDGGIAIFAAGNYNSTSPVYPGAYEGTLAVAAHDNQGKRSGFSSYGDWVHIIAPGTDVLSTELNNSYSYKSGTSMATPHVSGAAALVVSHAYGKLTNDELWDILLDSANEDIYEENPNFIGQLGSGRLDAYAALKKLNPSVTFEIEDEHENPIDSAIVTLDGQENEPGDYQFTNVEEGTYDYTVEKEGYFTTEGEVTVEEEDVTVEVTMFEKYTVTFDIEDEHGNEVTEATVTFDGEENEPGNYVFENIEDGTFEYKVEKDGYFTKEDEVTIEGDATVEVTLDGAYIVTFEIEDEFGNIVENAIITFDNIQNDPGEYVFKDIKSGTYDYEVEKDGYFTVVNDITVISNYIARVILEADGTSTEEYENINISVFPNPTRDIFYIESNKNIKEIRLTDISGQIIRDITVNNLNSKINVSNIRPGIYFMEIQTDESVITKRVKIAQ